MKVTRPQNVDVDRLEIDIPVDRYTDGRVKPSDDVLNADPGGDGKPNPPHPRRSGLDCADAMPADFPGRAGNRWRVEVDIPSHRIIGWAGPACSLWFKVCDEGTYRLKAGNEVIAELVEDYVPNNIVPGHYGDYMHLLVDEDGTIVNWDPGASAEDFE